MHAVWGYQQTPQFSIHCPHNNHPLTMNQQCNSMHPCIYVQVVVKNTYEWHCTCKFAHSFPHKVGLGLDCGTGLWDWTEGLDSQKVALIQFRSSTHTTTLQYTYITWTEFRADSHHSISISIGPDEVSVTISADVRAIQICVPARQISTDHYPMVVL